MSGSGRVEDDFLEEYYDVIILSTGLESSILAAALAKAGKSVLHVDSNEYYGQDTASFSFTQLLDWVEEHRQGCPDHAGGSTFPPLEDTVNTEEDLEEIGMRVARAHARRELEKRRAEEIRGANADDAGAADQARDQTESVDCVKAGKYSSTAPPPPPQQQQQQQQPGDANGTGEQAHVDPTPSAAINGHRVKARVSDDKGSTSDAAEDAAGEGMETKAAAEVARNGDALPREETNAAVLDGLAAERVRSADLRLATLRCHGCRTRAGAPSDACSAVRHRATAGGERGAGGFAREPAYSHPTWTGRRTPCRVEDGAKTDARGESADAGVHPTFWGYRTDKGLSASDLVRLSRKFNLDLTSQVLLAAGPAVDALLNSGVASYLEFRDMPALYIGADDANPAANTRAASARRKAGSDEARTPSPTLGLPNGKASSDSPLLRLSRVPCSKADVFGTKLLNPLEKRRLMRFLLFASDWALQRAGQDVLARNEEGLGRGRSLRRPQNREAASADFDADAHAGRPFREFLQSCGLPERVRAMITHALALLPGDGGEGSVNGAGKASLAPGEAATEAGLEAVYRHLSALGRFGETAFIAPLYGMSELPQAFCRMAAVNGAVYVLRRQLKGALVDAATRRCLGVVDESGRSFACGSLVIGCEYFHASSWASSSRADCSSSPLDQSSPDAAEQAANTGQTEKTTASDAHRRPRRRLLRRIVIASGPVDPQGTGRGLCVLPPGLRSVGNASAVHVVALDETTATCPGDADGACVLHLTTTVFDTDTHEDTVGTEACGNNDDGAVPNGACKEALGGTVTKIPEDENGSNGVLGRAAQQLLSAAGVREIWSVGFSWDVQEAPRPDELPSNVVVCARPGQEFYLHEVVIRAENAFARLCPGLPFWPEPAKGDGQDVEEELLEAAASAVVTENDNGSGSTDAVTGREASEATAGDVIDADPQLAPNGD